MSILIVGDSFSAPDPGFVVWHSILSQRLGGKKIYNHAQGSTGYINPGQPSPKRFTRQLLAHSDIPDVCDVELVIIFGSVNDRDFIPAQLDLYKMMVFTTHQVAKAEYPNAKQLIILPQWSGPNAKPYEIETMRAAIGNEMWGYDFQYSYVDPNPGSDYANWFFPPNRPEFWSGDQFHPNQLGHTRMADKIEPHVRNILGLS